MVVSASRNVRLHVLSRRLTAGLAVTACLVLSGCFPTVDSGEPDASMVDDDVTDDLDDDFTDDPDDSTTDDLDDDVTDDIDDDVTDDLDDDVTDDIDDGNTDDSMSDVPPPTTEIRDGITVTLADGYARPLETSCFYTTPIELPADWEFLDASDEDNCDFAFQGPMADVAVIAGEMWTSSSGQTFDESVAMVRSNLEAGTEPNILILGLLNSGPSGVPLEIYSEEEISSYQPAVLFTHQSERRDGMTAYSAVVEVPAPSDGSTMVILLWSVLPPGQEDLISEFIESMTTTLPVGFG